LGEGCYVGSAAHPIQLHLTDGTTAPPPPNKPIKGSLGEPSSEVEKGFESTVITGNTLVDNSFSAPVSEGCGALSFLIDPIINSKIGLPSAAGHNTAVLSGTLNTAETEAVVASEKFEASSKNAALEWGAGKTIACSGTSTFKGHFISSTEVEGSMLLSRCSGSRTECVNEKEALQSETLKGTLGYTNKAKKEVGLQLAGKSSETWANKVRCAAGTWPLTGKLAGKLNLQVNTKIPAGGALTRWSLAFYRTAKDAVPAREFLLGCPQSVREMLLAILVAVRDAPPPSFPPRPTVRTTWPRDGSCCRRVCQMTRGRPKQHELLCYGLWTG
jgi:hypothetical protein